MASSAAAGKEHVLAGNVGSQDAIVHRPECIPWTAWFFAKDILDYRLLDQVGVLRGVFPVIVALVTLPFGQLIGSDGGVRDPGIASWRSHRRVPPGLLCKPKALHLLSPVTLLSRPSHREIQDRIGGHVVAAVS
jgi:hypothetical protein